MNTDTVRSAHRCVECQSYLEVVLKDAMAILEICPSCLDSVAILRLSPSGERVKETK